MVANTLQLENMMATPNADVTPEQTGAAMAQGWKPSSEPSVISTDAGNKVLGTNIDNHNANVAATTPQPPATPDKTNTPTLTDAKKQAIKAQGGITADEANATGIDATKLSTDYSYDTNTGYYVPKNTTTENSIDTTYKKEVDNVNQQFQTMTQGMDTATANLLTSISGIYNQRLADQKDVNARYEAGINTENIRGGTSRYAPGVAGSIFTAAESYGIGKLTAISSELAGKLAEASQNLQDKKYTAFIANRAEYDKLTTERNTQIKDLHDAAVKKAMDDRNYKLDVQKFQETKDQNVFDRAYKTEQATFDEKYKTEQQAIEREKINAQYGTPSITSTIQAPAVQMTASGKPDPVAQKAILDQISEKYGPMTSIAIKGLVDYSRLPSDWSVRPAKGKGMSRADAVSLAQMIDPTYTEAGAPARQAYIKSLQSGPIYNGVISANKAINHLTSFADTVSKLGNKDPWSSSNKVSQNIRQAFGDSSLQTNVSKAKTEALGLSAETEKFFKGTGASDMTGIEEWKKNLDIGENPAKLKGTVQGALDLFAGQITVMNQAYTNTMGKPPDGSILQPETVAKLSNLKNQGYTVDIPGVYYTDPVAYSNKASENAAKLTEVRTAHPELSPAQATQLAQYLQENGQ